MVKLASPASPFSAFVHTYNIEMAGKEAISSVC